MTKRPLCLGAAGVLSGILAAAYGWSVFARALLACGVLACGILGGIFADGYRPGDGISPSERKRTAFGAGVFLLMFALGSGRYLEAEESRQAYLGELQDGMYVTVQGQLAGKQVQKNRYVYELTSCMFRTDSSNFLQAEPVSCGGVLIYSESDDCSIGDILIYHGEITLWKRASNEGAFDAKAYYFARGFDFAMEGPALDRKVCAKRQTAEALWQLGQQIKEVYLKTMGERDAGILATMVVGDREFLDAETKRLYQIGGLSHILAISGLHISVIGMALYRMLKKAGLPFGMAALAAAGVMYGYGGMAGWGVSVRRAVLMFLLFLGAQVIGRSYDTFCALAFAAVALLWKNPCLFWDAGFRFSFVAILGVVWVGQSISYEKKGMGALRGKIFAASAVWFTTLPLVAWYFYEIPVYAVFVNLLMLPMMGVLLGFGAAGGMVGLLSLPLAKGMLFPCRILLFMGKHICALAGMLPGAMWIVGRPQCWQIAVYYAFLGAGTCLVHRQREQREREKEHGRRAEQKSGGHPGVFLAALLLLAVLGVPRSGEAELDMLDVGQGDGCYLQTKEGYHLFVDGGSSNVGKVGTYRILPFLKYKGVKKIDCWVVSHTDEDHISGLREILSSGYPVEYLAVAEQMPRDENWEELEALAEDAGTKVVWLGRGDIWHFGNATFTALHPGETEAAFGGQSVDKNEESLVLFYQEDDFAGVFTGDIGTAQEEEILTWLQNTKTGANVQKIDFYKAAHHGSRYSNSTGFLEALAPEIALVSCSRTNRYGHPSKEAVWHMQQAGSQVYYTMESGRLCVKKTDGQAVCQGYLEEKEQWWQ